MVYIDHIQYIEKPDNISWDTIHECLMNAHAVNAVKGLHMVNQDLKGDELKNKFKNGHCFVALRNNQVIGVFGLRFFVGRRWWSWKKKVAYCCLDGILPEYQGTDVYFGLDELRMNYIKKSGADIIQCNTAETNTLVRKITKVKKFKTVHYSSTCKGADYYSVVMVKWLHGCPYPDWFINFMYKLSKFVVKMIWKPGYKFRFRS